MLPTSYGYKIERYIIETNPTCSIRPEIHNYWQVALRRRWIQDRTFERVASFLRQKLCCCEACLL